MNIIMITTHAVSIAHPEGPHVGPPRVLEYRADSVIALIDWRIIQTQHYEEDTAFSIDSIPEVIVVSMNSTSVQLQISYNTQYNVSITATLCGLGNTTATVTLHFGESRGALIGI